MAELINAMKGVIQSSTARTSSTYASTDLIQLYDSNNEPTIKIGKDDLMAAVKASLPSLLSDQGTSGTAFPSIASGVLGSMTAANLASVLSGTREVTLQGGDLNDFFETVRVTFGSQPTNRPSGATYGILQVIHADAYTAQIYYNGFGDRTWWRINLNGQSSGWYSWQEVALNIPAFYKDYSTLAELKAALDAL